MSNLFETGPEKITDHLTAAALRYPQEVAGWAKKILAVYGHNEDQKGYQKPPGGLFKADKVTINFGNGKISQRGNKIDIVLMESGCAIPVLVVSDRGCFCFKMGAWIEHLMNWYIQALKEDCRRLEVLESMRIRRMQRNFTPIVEDEVRHEQPTE